MKDARSSNSKAGAVLDYQVCRACGRNDYGMLLVRGCVVATGTEAQRAYLAIEVGITPTEPTPTPVDAPMLVEALDWRPASNQPTGAGLIRVRFITGGQFIERPSFFEGRWDLIDAWQPYDNRTALAASFNPPPIPAALRVGTVVLEVKHAARPMPPPRPEAIPIGVTMSLF